MWEVIFAKYAAPGMCNPADDRTVHLGHPHQAQIDTDDRTLGQRQHDAMLAIGRIALMSGELGHLNGLPVSVIIRTTLQDLESRAGIGVTGGGTKLPIADVIRMGAPRQPPPRRVRRSHRPSAGAVSHQAGRLARPADHADRPRRRLHQTVLHRGRLRLPGPPRHHGLGTRRQHQRRRHDPGVWTRQPRRRRRAAGRPASTPAANANGHPHPIWTTANPASTTTTAPKHSCDHPKTGRCPNPNHRNRSHRNQAAQRLPTSTRQDLDTTETPGGPEPPDHKAA